MKFGIRTPSLKRRFAARTSWKRVVRHSIGLKAPRGMGVFTNPKRALYNQVYNRTSVSVDSMLKNNSNKKISSSSSSFVLNTIIFLILVVVFFPAAVVFLLYKLYKRGKGGEVPATQNQIVTTPLSDNKLLDQYYIPEPTRSLLWVTEEDTSKISSPMTIKISIDVNNQNINMDDGHNFYGEPSLIWTKLPIEPNSELETKPMYYPSYSGLSPKHRFQYLNWLKDITQETNLSYVFLYYYGLERHMLVGNYDSAVEEILRLLKYHNKGSFVGYATSALIAASAYKKRPEIVSKAPILLQETSNESLLLRRLAGVSLTAKDIIKLSSRVGYSNKRYIKLYPDLFESELQKLIVEYASTKGNILSNIDTTTLPKTPNIFFANTSLPEKVRTMDIPDLIRDVQFQSVLRNLLSNAHEKVKEMKANSTAKPEDKKSLSSQTLVVKPPTLV